MIRRSRFHCTEAQWCRAERVSSIYCACKSDDKATLLLRPSDRYPILPNAVNRIKIAFTSNYISKEAKSENLHARKIDVFICLALPYFLFTFATIWTKANTVQNSTEYGCAGIYVRFSEYVLNIILDIYAIG